MPVRALTPPGFALLLTILLPLAAPAQQGEAYQSLTMAFGWGAIAPVEDTPFQGDALDADPGLQLAVGLEVRRTPWLLAYARGDADAAEIRQHLGLTGGLRLLLRSSGRIRPYAGAGAGLLWLEPKVNVAAQVQRQFALRGEGYVGADWAVRPGLRWFGEYRLAGARYTAVGRVEGCTAEQNCATESKSRLLHLGHTAWAGARIKLF
ncbi:MAG: hypothetical protein HY703_12815 [Gemmatimonadetes bacterium]|nr:hypothetical protein [Gemmatimonadota bacterium]